MSFPITLTLVTPHKRGKLVEEAQYLLNNNRWKGHFYGGKMDGEYGPLAAAAAHKAKYWLGYPAKKIDTAFGPKLRSYLLPMNHHDAKALPASYKLRRKARILIQKRKQKKLTPGQKALAEAKKWLGYREVPENLTVFGKWFGADGEPWCAYFVSYCLSKTGHPFHEGYVPTIVSWARTSSNGVYVTHDPKPGDLCCFDWDKNGLFDHIGFFDKWDNLEEFQTVEGNTLPPGGSGDQSNGGGVYARTRDTKSANVVFVRVKG